MGAVLSILSRVGCWAIIAEGSIVRMKQKVPARTVVAGNPAVTVREVADKDEQLWSYGKQLYIDLAHECLTDGMQPIG